jgi:ATP-binding cassette subfamily F protein 3
MLNIHNLSVSFGGSYLFEEVTFRLGSGDRVGLVKNGAGKSTMLKILAKTLLLIPEVCAGKK